MRLILVQVSAFVKANGAEFLGDMVCHFPPDLAVKRFISAPSVVKKIDAIALRRSVAVGKMRLAWYTERVNNYRTESFYLISLNIHSIPRHVTTKLVKKKSGLSILDPALCPSLSQLLRSLLRLRFVQSVSKCRQIFENEAGGRYEKHGAFVEESR